MFYSKKQGDISETWIGLTFQHATKLWTWINSCSYLHYPLFWRMCFDVKCNLQFATSDYYAKYSELRNGAYARTGVEPVLKTSKTKIDIVCYKVRVEV